MSFHAGDSFDFGTILVIRVLDPLLAHHFVAEIIAVLENRQPRHQPGRQRRPAGAIGIYRTELLLQKPPVDRPRQLRQRVLHVDDLIEPRTKQILLAASPPLPWSHRSLHQSHDGRESRLEIRGNPPPHFARKSTPQPQFPANPTAAIPANAIASQSLRDISRTTSLCDPTHGGCSKQRLACFHDGRWPLVLRSNG